jgi:hypothetical protein
LNDPCVFLELDSFDGFTLIRDELVEIEIGRLIAERSYCSSIGIDTHQAEWYASTPLSYVDDGARWDCLNLDWAPAALPIAQAGAVEILKSSRRTRLAPVQPFQAANLSSSDRSNVVHILSRVRDR